MVFPSLVKRRRYPVAQGSPLALERDTPRGRRTLVEVCHQRVTVSVSLELGVDVLVETVTVTVTTYVHGLSRESRFTGVCRPLGVSINTEPGPPGL